MAMHRHLPRDNHTRRLHASAMRWVLMLFVILAAVMGGEARAVVVMGRAVVVERGVEDTLRGASQGVAPEVEEVAGLEDAGPLALWFPGGPGSSSAAARRVPCAAWTTILTQGAGWAVADLDDAAAALAFPGHMAGCCRQFVWNSVWNFCPGRPGILVTR